MRCSEPAPHVADLVLVKPMRALFRTIWILSGAFAFLLAYPFGYYRGYQERSRILTAVQLSTSEAYHQQLEHGRFDLLRSGLEVQIYCDAESYRLLEQHPLQHFWRELSQSQAGDMTAKLQKADQITA